MCLSIATPEIEAIVADDGKEDEENWGTAALFIWFRLPGRVTVEFQCGQCRAFICHSLVHPESPPASVHTIENNGALEPYEKIYPPARYEGRESKNWHAQTPSTRQSFKWI